MQSNLRKDPVAIQTLVSLVIRFILHPDSLAQSVYLPAKQMLLRQHFPDSKVLDLLQVACVQSMLGHGVIVVLSSNLTTHAAFRGEVH